MQTFLPYSSFGASAACLDQKRLGKQRVECKQILVALGVRVGPHVGNVMSHWRNHPAVRMWRGYEIALMEYALTVCTEWRVRDFGDSLAPQFFDAIELGLRVGRSVRRPPWLGDESFHASHRSNLLRKDADHYSQFGWSEPDTLEYVWPVGSEVLA